MSNNQQQHQKSHSDHRRDEFGREERDHKSRVDQYHDEQKKKHPEHRSDR